MATIFDEGAVNVLGIYGGSASGGIPSKEVAFDVNQVPVMFFDYEVVRNGSPVFGILFDNIPLRDSVANCNLPGIGQKRPFSFWVPQKFRTVGRHSVTVQMGHTTYKKRYLLFGKGAETFVPVYKWQFNVTFTGTKQED